MCIRDSHNYDHDNLDNLEGLCSKIEVANNMHPPPTLPLTSGRQPAPWPSCQPQTGASLQPLRTPGLPPVPAAPLVWLCDRPAPLLSGSHTLAAHPLRRK
eukprot:TRINITY_DN2001_c0_g2_i1.p2 TRINITY_DN2001_c0_g2~~TRINITY_DN2001_c0_g2_i1.p2  ORF type:complete len:100 (+),score=4.51 TRINITY_DN2001_c0_g2_i1:52-351(+)